MRVFDRQLSFGEAQNNSHILNLEFNAGEDVYFPFFFLWLDHWVTRPDLETVFEIKLVSISVSRPVSTTKCHTLGLTLPNGWVDHQMQCCLFSYATKCRLCCSRILTNWTLRVIDSFITCAPRTLSSLYNIFWGCKKFLSDLCGRESYLFREINGVFNLTWQQNLKNLIILVAPDAAQ